jgi:hypothetical protein
VSPRYMPKGKTAAQSAGWWRGSLRSTNCLHAVSARSRGIHHVPVAQHGTGKPLRNAMSEERHERRKKRRALGSDQDVRRRGL